MFLHENNWDYQLALMQWADDGGPDYDISGSGLQDEVQADEPAILNVQGAPKLDLSARLAVHQQAGWTIPSGEVVWPGAEPFEPQ